MIDSSKNRIPTLSDLQDMDSQNQKIPKKQHTSNCILKSAIICFLFNINAANAFNFEPKLPIIRTGPEGSNFGYSVATYKSAKTDDGFSFDNSYILVGAPTDALKKDQALRQQELPPAKEPGAIYACPINKKTAISSCKKIELNLSTVSVAEPRCPTCPMEFAGDLEKNSNSTEQFLGASLVTSEVEGGKIIACAPRWKQRNGIKNAHNEEESLGGQCWVIKFDETRNRFVDDSGYGNEKYFRMPTYLNEPKRGYPFSPKRYIFQHAAFGTGLAMSPDGESYALGGPGAYSNSGNVVGVDTKNTTEFYMSEKCNPHNNDRRSRFKVCNEMIHSTQAGYTGFSLKISDNFPFVDGDKSRIIVAGAPNQYNTGGLFFLRKNLNDELEQSHVIQGRNLFKAEGKKGFVMGSSLGYSLEVADLNGDGFDDLIVGAPQYFDGVRKGGCVVVYLSSGTKHQIWDAKPIFIHRDVDSFFGISITKLGDINGDGKEDVAIGAPYTTSESKSTGSVYIFYGDAEVGLLESQVITPSDLPDKGKKYSLQSIQGFGYSVSSQGVNLDNDGYPDLAIGTLSDKIIVLRTRPLIKISAEVTFNKINNNGQDVINLKSNGWNGNMCDDGGKKYRCIKVDTCFNYESKAGEAFKKQVLSASIVLDERLRFDTIHGTFEDTVQFELKNERYCMTTRNLFLAQDLKDTLNPMTVSVTLNHTEASIYWDFSREYISLQDKPKVQTINTEKSIHLVNDCGEDQKCLSKLTLGKVYLETWNEVSQRCEANHGSSGVTKIFINGNLNNTEIRAHAKKTSCPRLIMNMKNEQGGEDAHRASFKFYLPTGVNLIYDRIFVNDELNSKVAKIVCAKKQVEKSLKSDGNDIGMETEFTCTLNKPLKGGEHAVLKIPVDFSKSQRKDWGDIAFSVRAETDSTQDKYEKSEKRLKMEVNAPLSLSAVANVQQVQISDVEKSKLQSEYNFADEVGPEVTYTLIAKNHGKIDFNNVEISFQYPTRYDLQQDDGGKEVLYLYKVQKTTTETALKQVSGSTETKIVVSDPMNRAYENREKDVGVVKELVNPNGYKNRLRRFIWGKNVDKINTNECARDEVGDKGSRMVSYIRCGDDKCVKNKCETIYWKVPYLPANSFVELNLKFFISNKTILQEFEGVENIHIQTTAKLSVNNDYTRISDAQENQAYLSKELTITVDHQAMEIEEDGPSKWWFIIVGGLVAILLYLILFCIAKKMGCFTSTRPSSSGFTITDVDNANTSHRRSIKKEADDYQRRMSTASGGWDSSSRAGTTLERRASQRGHSSQPPSSPNSQYNTLEKTANVGAGSAHVNME